MVIETIFKNNASWIQKKLDLDSHFFEDLSKGQSPQLLYIGCSDSRVTAEEIMGLSPGEVFVHRNIANLVNSIDLNVISVIVYAIQYLKVDHIVVCGHYFCGGVKAAMESSDMGILNPWLRNIRDVYRLHKDKLDIIEDETERYKRLVELNVQEQCLNLLKMAVVQQAYVERGVTVHGWVFDVHSGKLIDLEIDLPAILKETMDIYRHF
jgi:carbonic anhydrase